jgi:hypothetical protein
MNRGIHKLITGVNIKHLQNVKFITLNSINLSCQSINFALQVSAILGAVGVVGCLNPNCSCPRENVSQSLCQ